MTLLCTHTLLIAGKQYDCSKCKSKLIIEYAGNAQAVRFIGGDINEKEVTHASGNCTDLSDLLGYPYYCLTKANFYLREQIICDDCYQQQPSLDADYAIACTQLFENINKMRIKANEQKTAKIAFVVDMVMKTVDNFSQVDLQQFLHDIGVELLLGHELGLLQGDKLPVKSGLWHWDSLERYIGKEVRLILDDASDVLDIPNKLEMLTFAKEHNINSKFNVLMPYETWQQESRNDIIFSQKHIYIFTPIPSQSHHIVYKIIPADLDSLLKPVQIDYSEVMLALRKHKPVSKIKTKAKQWFAPESSSNHSPPRTHLTASS